MKAPVPPRKKKSFFFFLLSPLIHPSFPLISIFFISLLPPLISFPWHLEDMVGGGKGGGRASITSLARMNIFPSAPPGRAEGAMQRRTFRQGGPERNTETCVCKPLGEGEGSGQMSRQGGFTYRTPDLGAPETRGRSETCVSRRRRLESRRVSANQDKEPLSRRLLGD